MSAKSVALVGYRGTGKTSAGRLLARRLALPFEDMDERLVRGFGRDIRQWVEEHGWKAFRDAESRLLEELAQGPTAVVATGGGAVARPSNRELLRTRFRTFWLQASAETVVARLTADPLTASLRPPLSELSFEEEIVRLLAERRPWYQESARWALATDGIGPEELAERVAAELEAIPERRENEPDRFG